MKANNSKCIIKFNINGVSDEKSIFPVINSSSYKNISVSSSAFTQNNSIELQKNIINSNIIIDFETLDKKKVDDFIEEFSQIFLQTMKDDILEDGMISKVDLLCQEYFLKNKVLFLQALNEVFIRNFSNGRVVVFVLSVLSKMNYSDVIPNGETMVLLALNHNSLEVKDYALSAIDTWGVSKFADSLRCLEVKSKWMNDYIQKILKDLIQ